MVKENEMIVRCFEAFDFKDRLWIFMELLDCGALTQMIATMNGDYSEGFIRYVLNCTLKGLVCLHDRHIIHRDIKSDNILCSSKGAVKLADFGYAVQLTSQK